MISIDDRQLTRVMESMAINTQTLVKALIETMEAIVPDFKGEEAINKSVEIFEKHNIPSGLLKSEFEVDDD